MNEHKKTFFWGALICIVLELLDKHPHQNYYFHSKQVQLDNYHKIHALSTPILPISS
jgi:hypothetical protein